jgi:hypothetical protein
MLPENTEIDDKNNILVNLEFKISDIWQRPNVDVHVGNRMFSITPSLLRLSDHQKLVFTRQGISKINTDDVYDISRKGDVVINIALSL